MRKSFETHVMRRVRGHDVGHVHGSWTRPKKWGPTISYNISFEHVPVFACCYILFLHVFGIRMYVSRENIEGTCFSVFWV